MRSIAPDIALVKEYIIQNLHTPLTVCSLSENFSIGSSTLRRYFYNYHKASIHRFILQQRMIKALNLIKQRNYPISEIAIQVGYSEISNFSHAFRKYFGVSPSTISKLEVEMRTEQN